MGLADIMEILNFAKEKTKQYLLKVQEAEKTGEKLFVSDKITTYPRVFAEAGEVFPNLRRAKFKVDEYYIDYAWIEDEQLKRFLNLSNGITRISVIPFSKTGKRPVDDFTRSFGFGKIEFDYFGGLEFVSFENPIITEGMRTGKVHEIVNMIGYEGSVDNPAVINFEVKGSEFYGTKSNRQPHVVTSTCTIIKGVAERKYNLGFPHNGFEISEASYLNILDGLENPLIEEDRMKEAKWTSLFEQRIDTGRLSHILIGGSKGVIAKIEEAYMKEKDKEL